MNKNLIKQIVYSAMFLAIGLVLPLFTGQIKQIGNMLLPMHFVVLLCGYVCKIKWAVAVGFIMPLLRSAIFGMPIMYPNAFAMAFELATYGLVVAAMYKFLRRKKLLAIYASLISAQLSGRVVWGIVQTIILGLSNKPYSFSMFFASAFVNSLPGIVIQLILIPLIVILTDNLKLQKYN